MKINFQILHGCTVSMNCRNEFHIAKPFTMANGQGKPVKTMRKGRTGGMKCMGSSNSHEVG